MKKLITTFAALALIVSVSSCKDVETKTDETQVEKTEAPEGDTASEDATSTEGETTPDAVEATKEEN